MGLVLEEDSILDRVENRIIDFLKRVKAMLESSGTLKSHVVVLILQNTRSRSTSSIHQVPRNIMLGRCPS